VQFDGAPLIDVIQALARQVEINLIFDPWVLKNDYPPVSLRLENVSARKTLEAVLRNNELRMAADRKISRRTVLR
jgi:hypothetical protein